MLSVKSSQRLRQTRVSWLSRAVAQISLSRTKSEERGIESLSLFAFGMVASFMTATMVRADDPDRTAPKIAPMQAKTVVTSVAAVGSPDPVRTEIVKAFIVLKGGVEPDPRIEEDIKKFVKVRLAAHEYPREIEFVSELPMTATGKIMRKELKKMEVERKSDEIPR